MGFTGFNLNAMAEDPNCLRRIALRARIQYVLRGLERIAPEEVWQWELAATSDKPEELVAEWIRSDISSPATSFLLQEQLVAFTAEALVWSSKFTGLFSEEIQNLAQQKIGASFMLLDCDFATGGRMEECKSGIQLLQRSIDWQGGDEASPDYDLVYLAKIISEKLKRLLKIQRAEVDLTCSP